MSAPERTSVVFARYWVYQIPGMFVAALVLTVLVRWEQISQGVAFLLFGFWVLKDLLLFPVTRIGYERGGQQHGADALAGRLGRVQDEDLDAERTGWVRVGPELWRAVSAGPVLAAGTRVRIVEVRGLVLVVHGGAGNVRRGEPGEQGMRRALLVCLKEGRARLAEGASALDTVEGAVRRLEAHALFNAGRGSVLTSEGTVEMDACLMDGASRAAGSVCSVRRLAHPVSAARIVMERSPHVLLSGPGAEAFALAEGAEAVEPSELGTVERREQLLKVRERSRVVLDHESGGTVGAVARDARGHLAAATSTGGMTNKLPGRVSDSALAGSGTWADDATCAVSTTGHGESMIRAAVAHEVDALLRLAGLSLEAACERALARAREHGGRGGLIALDTDGRFAAPFTTRAMYRVWIAADGDHTVLVVEGEVPA